MRWKPGKASIPTARFPLVNGIQRFVFRNCAVGFARILDFHRNIPKSLFLEPVSFNNCAVESLEKLQYHRIILKSRFQAFPERGKWGKTSFRVQSHKAIRISRNSIFQKHLFQKNLITQKAPRWNHINIKGGFIWRVNCAQTCNKLSGKKRNC